jgi:Dolichyl-phosphate-mannose-protein mannosyltransferase
MRPMRQLPGWIVSVVAGAFFLLLSFQLIGSVRHETQTYDEAYHIYAGYLYWTHRDYGINPEHPPLVKLLATAPLLDMPLQQVTPGNGLFKTEGYLRGRDFLYSNDADRILLRTRLAAMLLTLLTALLVFAAAREMFADLAALISLALLTFEPNILANGALVTTDIGISCFLFATVYAFYRYVRVPSVSRLCLTGLAFGLALASKHTGILVTPILLLLTLCEWIPAASSPKAGTDERERALRLLGGLLFGCVVAFLILWLLCGLALGVSAGLMKAAQYTLIIALPVLGLKSLLEILPSAPAFHVSVDQWVRRAARSGLSLLAIGVIGFVVLWSAYGFRYTARPHGLQMSPSLSAFEKELSSPMEEHVISSFARFHILPEAYLYGLVDIRRAGEHRFSTIFGKVYLEGQWFYFPVAFVIKSTIGFMLLIGITVLAILLGRFTARREILFLVVPAVVYFVIAMSSGLNMGIRHALPVYPLLAVLAGGGTAALLQRNRQWSYVIGLLLAWHAVSTIRSFPVYLAYSNEIWGGPRNTYKVLSDSNVDWGQQLKSVSQYLRQNRIANCYFAYLEGTLVDLNYYGVPCKLLPVRESLALGSPFDVPPTVDGPVLISATVSSGSQFGPGELNPYSQFTRLRPAAVIDGGVLVFNGGYDISQAAALNLTGRAQQLMDEGRAEEALRVARLGVNTAPNSFSAQIAVAEVLIKLNRPKEAQVACRKATELAQTLGPEYREWTAAVVDSVQKSMRR